VVSNRVATTSWSAEKGERGFESYRKTTYDRINKVQQPKWKVGDEVLIRKSVKRGSPRVVTKHRFEGPYIIEEIIKGRPDVGTAYMLRNKERAKAIRNLVSNNRLKAYNVDRQEFTERLPRIQTSEDKEDILNGAADNTPGEAKLVEILSEHKIDPSAKKQYLVRFTDKRNYLCDWVNKALMDHYKAKRTKDTSAQ